MAIGIGVSVLAVVILLHQVSVADLASTLGTARPLPLVALVASVFVTLAPRALRWQALLRPTRRVPLRPLLSTLTISYMASTILPLRAGELVRAAFLAEREKLGLPLVAATIVIEKLFDFLAIGAMLAILVVTVPLPPAARVAGGTIAGVTLVGFACAVALAWWPGPVLRLAAELERHLPGPLARRVPLARLARDVALGTSALAVPSLWLPLLGWSAVVWLCSLPSIWLGGLALGTFLSGASTMFTVVVTSTGQAVPSSPGYVGVYQAAVTFALESFGLGAAVALGVAVLTWAFTYVPLVLAGIGLMWVDGYAASDLLAALRGSASAGRPAEAGPPPAGAAGGLR